MHQIKAQQFYTDLGLYQQLNPDENSKIQGFSRPWSDFLVLFKADLIFKDYSYLYLSKIDCASTNDWK